MAKVTRKKLTKKQWALLARLNNSGEYLQYPHKGEKK
jgi:hypothetical protein